LIAKQRSRESPVGSRPWTPDSAIKNFAQLRKRIIQPAVAELKAKDGMDIEWTPKKQGGRKITALEFVFQKQARPGESYETAAARIAKNREMGLSG